MSKENNCVFKNNFSRLKLIMNRCEWVKKFWSIDCRECQKYFPWIDGRCVFV